MNKICLIGETGFVGNNLKKLYKFDDMYNSKNIKDIQGKEYDAVFCAAPSAVKWLANKDPVSDLNSIINLINVLKNVKTKKFFLFSTIDVYGHNLLGSENDIIDIKNNHAYGRNRYILEIMISKMFDTHVLRLPGLFGDFLKKNIIYDLINKNMLENITPHSQFQWLYLDRLKFFIDFAQYKNISTLNCATEPICTYEIIDSFFSEHKNVCKNNQILNYNLKTAYTESGYFLDKIEVLADLGVFLKNEIDIFK